MKRIDVSSFKDNINEPRGYSEKYWTSDGKKLIKYNGPTSMDGDVMECLASLILKELNIDTIDVSLGYNSDFKQLEELDICNPNCCIIDTFLTDSAEIVINLLNNKWVKVNTSDTQKNISSSFYKMFSIFGNLMDISSEDFEEMKKAYIRMVFGDCIIDNEDRRLKNIEAIYNEKTFSYRLAPSFDNALAFNAYTIGAEEGYCYIGNQEFPVSEIIYYILTHYYEYVDDIVQNLSYLAEEGIVNIFYNFMTDIPKEKIIYIYDYINYINQLIKYNLSNKHVK